MSVKKIDGAVMLFSGFVAISCSSGEAAKDHAAEKCVVIETPDEDEADAPWL